MSEAIGIDVGGTFVDVVVAGDGGTRLFKFPATPATPAEGVLDGLTQLVRDAEISARDVRRIAHGSTVATNALLERTWARTALLTTRGFRDVLEIGRQDRPDLYSLAFDRPTPIVPRDLRFEVDERIDHRGRVLRPLDEEGVRAVGQRLRGIDVAAIAIVLLFSYLDPSHERAAKRILEETLSVPITLSSDVHPEFREYERTSTTVVSASLRPVLGGYLSVLESGARALGIGARWQVMQSNGAIMRADAAEDEPARLLLSGPAAGVEGACAAGRLSGEEDLITLDMGGTSADVALVQGGVPGRTMAGRIGGHPVALPMVDVHTIGAGGGSIARLDAGGALQVGPRSAGASPGPACYGRGGREATVTDAHLVLGHLVPDRPLGGLKRLDVAAARCAVEGIATRLGLSVEETALGMLDVADAAMERAIRVISVERGHDPRRFALLAFGGGGPLHAVSIARRLGMKRVLLPAAAGVLSAYGLLVAELGHEQSQGVVRPLQSIDRDALGGMIRELRGRGASALAADGVDRDAMAFVAFADLRYLGQAHELTVPLPLHRAFADVPDVADASSLEEAFHAAHKQRYGHAAIGQPVELIAVRVRAVGPAEEIVWSSREPARDETKGATGKAWFSPDGPTEVRILERDGLVLGDAVVGPAIVLGADATALLAPGTRARLDRQRNLIVEVE